MKPLVALGKALMVAGYGAAYDLWCGTEIGRGEYDHWSRRVNTFASDCIAMKHGYPPVHGSGRLARVMEAGGDAFDVKCSVMCMDGAHIVAYLGCPTLDMAQHVARVYEERGLPAAQRAKEAFAG